MADRGISESKLIINAYIGEEIEIDGPAKIVFAGFSTRGQGELIFHAPKSTKIKRLDSKYINYAEISPRPLKVALRKG